jgi:uncharacterized protein (DUF1778 family)
MITTKENRENRFSIRATPKQKDLIARAAQRSNRPLAKLSSNSFLFKVVNA